MSKKFLCVINADGSSRVEEISGDGLKQAQEAVEGYIESLPATPKKPRLVTAFVNDEGALRNLPQNELAAYVLDALNVDTTSGVACLIWGNVVVTGLNDKGLSEEEANAVNALCAFYRAHDPEDEPPKHIMDLFAPRKRKASKKKSSPSPKRAKKDQ